MEERIRYLFRRYLQNNCSPKELEEFFRYIRDANQDELLRSLVKKVYDGIREAASPLAGVDGNGDLILMEPTSFPQPEKPGQAAKKRLRLALAAVAVIVITGSIFWINHSAGPQKNDSPAMASFTKKITERSEFKYLLLPDSTQVWLNAGSSLEFPGHFNDKKREVYLHGEAYFDVRHSEKTPFIIHTGEVYTTVLGTAFNIKAYPGQKNIIISVSRGKVRVNRGDIPVAVLTKGQQVKLDSHDHHFAEKNIAVTDVAAWQQGNMAYEDENFGDIIEDLERIYNVDISLAKSSIRDLKVSTSFRREIGIEQALEILCRLTDTELKQGNGVYTIQ